MDLGKHSGRPAAHAMHAAVKQATATIDTQIHEVDGLSSAHASAVAEQRLIERLSMRIQRTPHLRQERIDPLQTLIAFDLYHPAAHEIADAIIRDESR